mgnify:CR=1 FL=1
MALIYRLSADLNPLHADLVSRGAELVELADVRCRGHCRHASRACRRLCAEPGDGREREDDDEPRRHGMS